MRAILVQQGTEDALKGEENMPSTLSNERKTEILANNSIILSLGDKVLREVSKEKSAAAIWTKLENLYMTNSL